MVVTQVTQFSGHSEGKLTTKQPFSISFNPFLFSQGFLGYNLKASCLILDFSVGNPTTEECPNSQSSKWTKALSISKRPFKAEEKKDAEVKHSTGSSFSHLKTPRNFPRQRTKVWVVLFLHHHPNIQLIGGERWWKELKWKQKNTFCKHKVSVPTSCWARCIFVGILHSLQWDEQFMHEKGCTQRFLNSLKCCKRKERGTF